MTGTPNKKLSMVIATNLPNEIDNAILDRIDEIVNFQNPNEFMRKDLLNFFIDKYYKRQ